MGGKLLLSASPTYELQQQLGLGPRLHMDVAISQHVLRSLGSFKACQDQAYSKILSDNAQCVFPPDEYFLFE